MNNFVKKGEESERPSPFEYSLVKSISILHCTLDISVRISLGDILALVIVLFTLAKTESHLYSRAFEIKG